MICKAWLTLLMLMSLTLVAACSPAQTTSTPVPNMPNPAAVYCEQQGGKLEIVTAADGSQSGLCIFPDGNTCDEWAYFRGECKPGDSLAKPAPTPAPEPNMPNPASVYCEQHGGKLEIVTSQNGLCIFPDGSTCEEWAYFRGECEPGVSLVTPVPRVSPTTVSASPTPVATLKPTVLRVAYEGGSLSKSCHIMLWTEGEVSRQLADCTGIEGIRISDDGQVIAYTSRNSHGIYEIWAVNADGTNHRLLVGEDYVQNLPPVQWPQSFDFAPASHTLYFMTDQFELHRVSADSGSPSLVVGSGKGGYFRFSPDGQWMTLYHPRELVLAHSDGSAARVVYEWDPQVGVGTIGPEIIWAPDSAGFRMVELTDQAGDPNSKTVWYFPINGNLVKQMSFIGPYGGNLSPDGRTVVYLDPRHDPVDVHIVTTDGKDVIYGSFSGDYNPWFMGWAPDSKHFLLNLSKEDLRLEVPYLCAAGEQPARLTDIDDANAVVWVDTQRVLFDRRGWSLHLQRVGMPSILLDANASSVFDYTFVSP